MPHNPLVSIVLPTFNGERFLEQAIRSCLDQAYRPIEVIVVDDASTDSTARIVDRMAKEDSRVQIIRHERNRKLPAALNTGFASVKGEFLTWHSDDNYYLPNAIAEMVNFLRTQPDVDVIYTDYTVLDEEGNRIRKQKARNFEELAHKNCIGPCFLYRRRVQERVGEYSENYFLAEDYDFWLRASVQCKMVPMHQDLYCYRDHKKSLTQVHSDGRGRKACDAVLANNLPKLWWLDRGAKAEAFLTLARYARWREENHLAARLLLRAGFYSPVRFFRFMLANRKGTG
ncbi:MAG: glycosyltransferase [Phycisphaerae bacterium]